MSDIPSLLPPSAAPAEHATARALGARLEAIPAPLRALWSAAECPAALLPYLAWGLAVRQWGPYWGEARCREVVGTAIPVARIRGTVASLRAALAAAGYGAVVIHEGDYPWRYGDGQRFGAPGLAYGNRLGWASYQVEIPRPITDLQAAAIRRICDETAPARCRLSAVKHPLGPWVYGDGTLFGPAVQYYATTGVT